VLKKAVNCIGKSSIPEGGRWLSSWDKWRFTAIYCAAKHGLCRTKIINQVSVCCFGGGYGSGFQLLPQTVGLWSSASAMA